MDKSQKAVCKKFLRNLKNHIGIYLNIDSTEPPGRGKVLAGLWIQVIGGFIESVGITEEFDFLRREAERIKNGDLSNLSSEEKAVFGEWLQAIGQAVEAIGFSKQLSKARTKQIEGRKLAILGNLMKAYGSSLEAIAEAELLLKDEAKQFLF